MLFTYFWSGTSYFVDCHNASSESSVKSPVECKPRIAPRPLNIQWALGFVGRNLRKPDGSRSCFLLFFGVCKQIASGCEGEELRAKYHKAFPIDSVPVYLATLFILNVLNKPKKIACCCFVLPT